MKILGSTILPIVLAFSLSEMPNLAYAHSSCDGSGNCPTQPQPQGGSKGISPGAAVGIAAGTAVLGAIIGTAINSMNQQNQNTQNPPYQNAPYPQDQNAPVGQWGEHQNTQTGSAPGNMITDTNPDSTAVIQAQQAAVKDQQNVNASEPPEPGSKEAQILILQAEIDARKKTNEKVQEMVNDYNVDGLKEILGKSVIDATGKINQDLFDKQPIEIQKEMRQFEKGHLARDLNQSGQLAGGFIASIFSPGQVTLTHAQIEKTRNDLFIQQLQQKIDSLKNGK